MSTLKKDLIKAILSPTADVKMNAQIKYRYDSVMIRKSKAESVSSQDPLVGSER